MQTTVEGPGTLTFWWKVSSEYFFDPLVFSSNGVEQARISGEVDWQQFTFFLPENRQTLQWKYSKNAIVNAGGDAGWLDEVTYQPGATGATIATNPPGQTVAAGVNVIFSVAAFGTPPLSYQWQFNETNITGANGPSLILPNVQTNLEGVYSVAVTNGYGTAFSAKAILTINPSAPVIFTQPASKFALPDGSATFTFTARGSDPLGYQWQFNSNDIASATNPTLTLTNVQITDAGNYRVVVTNAYGGITSSNAALSLIDLLALAKALDATNLVWSTGTEFPWQVQTNVTHDGVDAAFTGKTGTILSGSQPVWLQTTVTGPGTISFWWSVSDYTASSLEFWIDSITRATLSGRTGWYGQTYSFSAGNHVLLWRFIKITPPYQQDAGYLDQVSFVASGVPPTIILGSPTNQTVSAGTTVQYGVTATGTPPLSYQWSFNGTNLPGANGSSLSLTNVQPVNSGNYRILVSNAHGTRATNVTLTVLPFLFTATSTNLQMRADGFQMLLRGVIATNSVVIHASTDLINWLPIFTNPPATGSLLFLDPAATNFPFRFYRASEK